MKKNPWLVIALLLVVLIGGFLVFLAGSAFSLFQEPAMKVSKNSILHLKLDGIIVDGGKFLKQLKKYRKDDRIKAIVIQINSPGGVVAPSEEIFWELKRTREEHEKAVVVSGSSLMASGAYYVAAAANSIVVNRGTLMGSIGVIMEFANLEKLYSFIKIDRFAIATGKYKDSGAEYRPMREDEKALFQGMANQVLQQFKSAIATNRKIEQNILDEYADGRIFTGEKGVELGFADKIGTLEDAIHVAAEIAELGDDYEIFEPPKSSMEFLDMLLNHEDEWESRLNELARGIVNPALLGKPLFLMPGAF